MDESSSERDVNNRKKSRPHGYNTFRAFLELQMLLLECLPSLKKNQLIPINVTRNQVEKGWLTSKRMSLDSRKMLISVSDALEICNRASCLSQQQTSE